MPTRYFTFGESDEFAWWSLKSWYPAPLYQSQRWMYCHNSYNSCNTCNTSRSLAADTCWSNCVGVVGVLAMGLCIARGWIGSAIARLFAKMFKLKIAEQSCRLGSISESLILIWYIYMYYCTKYIVSPRANKLKVEDCRLYWHQHWNGATRYYPPKMGSYCSHYSSSACSCCVGHVCIRHLLGTL